MNFKFQIGDRVGGWALLLPLYDDSWLAADEKGRIANIIPDREEDCANVVTEVVDVVYFVCHSRKFGRIDKMVKKTIDIYEFRSVCHEHGCVRTNSYANKFIGRWERVDKNYWIAYGRLRELVPEPNCLVTMGNEIIYWLLN